MVSTGTAGRSCSALPGILSHYITQSHRPAFWPLHSMQSTFVSCLCRFMYALWSGCWCVARKVFKFLREGSLLRFTWTKWIRAREKSTFLLFAEVFFVRIRITFPSWAAIRKPHIQEHIKLAFTDWWFIWVLCRRAALPRERKLCEEWKYLQDCHCLRVQEVTCFDCAISSAESAAFEVAFDFFHQCAAFLK